MWWIIPLGLLCIVAGTAILNTLTFPRLDEARPPWSPFVSVLIPARNEADTIGETVEGLAAQDYPGQIEIIVLDDESSDRTAAIAREAGAEVIGGEPLPEGWLGKNWACWQLSQRAQGDILLFTDADVQWEAAGVSAVIAQMWERDAAMLTVWPTQITRTWAERLTVPTMALAIIGYLPDIAVRHIPWPIFAAANGQCLAFRRAAYERIGGHKAERDNVVEDMGLARNTKREHLKLVMADGAGLVCCRMYDSWPEVLNGFAKNILAGHDSLGLLLASTIFHWALFVVPWVWLIGGWGAAWPQVPLVMVVLGVLIRALTAAATRQRIADAVLMPVSAVLMTIIAARSLGRVEWKGREV